MKKSQKSKGAAARFLHIVEVGGNALPHPATLFALLAVGVVLFSGLAAWLGWSATHPATGEAVEPFSLVSVEGLQTILTNMVGNFTGFAPLGTVLVAMLGIGIAERTGLIGAVLRLLVLSAPRPLLTFVIVLAGILSNTASEVGYVLLVPLGGMIFFAVGRHPIAGLAAAFAGVSGGYSANVLIGTIDPLLAGLSEEAAQIIDPGYTVNPACNYYFMVASVLLIAIAGTWVTEKIVVPRLGEWKGRSPDPGQHEDRSPLDPLTAEEKRGLRWALVVSVLFVAFLVAGTVPASGYLRDPATGGLLRSPLTLGVVAVVFFGAGAVGVVYGVAARTIKNDEDVVEGMAESMRTLGTYIVLVFFAAQFVAYFRETNLGLIFAIQGAGALEAVGLQGLPLMISFVFVSAIINLFMGSASAKWAIMAPVFVPMFMLLGYSPEMTQAAYRVGDSSSNVISPLMSYFPLIIVFFKRYDPKAGIGTVVATMLPYTIVFVIVWTILLSVWFAFDIPVGPGSPMNYDMS
jgi:aminobenzoyl-glutamate transport protein